MRFFRPIAGVLSLMLMLATGLAQPLGASTSTALPKKSSPSPALAALSLVQDLPANANLEAEDDDLKPQERLRAGSRWLDLKSWRAEAPVARPTMQAVRPVGRSLNLVGVVELRI